ncbi:hypothetical protein F1559_003152 [Cyanidiococcus yangmingshanensis]|uniref:Uncharacterized protein n=1 Tax=Cyanidiococcus yangmingshanensis TaxID=2690220 RepID=A0A7J7ILF4_9RHOD|nr:hypothetical protein F1559_003152 [Cyanidiococcus yangmingshanensis]
MAPASRPVTRTSPRPAAPPTCWPIAPDPTSGSATLPAAAPAQRADADPQAGRQRPRATGTQAVTCPGTDGGDTGGPGAASTPFASLLAVSSAFHPLFKVLFIFPSRYLFAIGLSPVFSFR